MKGITLLSALFLSSIFACFAQNSSQPDEILGKWMSEENNLIVQVYKENNEYKGKIIWFNDPEEDRDINLYYDVQNPNPALRHRKILGMDVLEKLKYDPANKSWEDGTIYDATSGRIYSSAISMNKDRTLKVTGYWKFKFIGRSMTFKKFTASTSGLASR